MKERLNKIAPWVEIIAWNEMFKSTEADRLILSLGKPDFVLDCIDDIHTKGELLAFCIQNEVKVLTAMGAGGKADPTKIRIASLNDCVNDPLASKIKWKLRKLGIKQEDMPVAVYSIEKPVVDLLPLDEDQIQSPENYGSVDYFRIRVMPVLGTSPSIFGQSMASYVLNSLAGNIFNYDGYDVLSKKLKHKMRQFFRNNEIERFRNYEMEDLLDDDLEFIIQTVSYGNIILNLLVYSTCR